MKEKRKNGELAYPHKPFTFEELNAVFRHENGRLFWKIKPNRKIVIGSSADSVLRNGYPAVQYKRRPMMAHRIIWLLVKGEWPKEFLDHKNGIRTDNRIENLRECNMAQNHANRRNIKRRSIKNVGLGRGVVRDKKSYRAGLGSECLGLFKSEVEAMRAYDAAAFKKYGEFAVLNFPEEHR